MGLNELTYDEIVELKGNYYLEHNENVSYGEMANVDTLVTMEELEQEYGATDFVKDDFFCNTNSLETAE